MLFLNKTKFNKNQLKLLLFIIKRNYYVPQNGDVLVSKSKDIYNNLSLEDWIYRNGDLSNKNILLLWYNDPAIVVGRHQNPWRECHLNECVKRNVSVVRRNSGGGTVFHDLGNLNCSFITERKCYNRKNNLTLIGTVLRDYWSIECDISKREDLVLHETGEKVSGTASKLGTNNAYHHCTLLINVDMNLMRNVIRNSAPNIESKATQSIASPTKNLKELNNYIDIHSVIRGLANEFTNLHDSSRGIIEILPEESQFPGIKEIEESYRSWKWIYGKTPRFCVHKSFDLTSINYNNCKRFTVTIEINHGIIEKVLTEPLHINLDFEGVPFTIENVETKINNELINRQSNSSFDLFVAYCITQCIRETL